MRDWHTIGFRPVVVSVTATDRFNMSTTFAFNVTIFSANNNPVPELAPVVMVGNGATRRINITTLQDGGDISPWRVVDADMETDVGGDAVVFLAASIDEPSLARVEVYRLAVGGNATPGAVCAGNCSVSPDGQASLCWTQDNTWGFCRHVLEIVLYPYQFGKARARPQPSTLNP